MIESTARAERYDLQTSTSSSFLWEVPQKPVAVRIPYDLMDRLERQAVESFRSVTSRGSEIGGLLIGSATAGSPMVVSVAEYQVIDCEYSRGPLYRLSEADLVNFQRAIQQRMASGGGGIAGFFRTHTRKGISLDTDDLAVLDAHFREPHHIGLLVRPFATKASTGGIFIREGGKISGDSSYLEFPFRSPGAENRPHVEEPEAKAAPQAASTSAPKPVARGQIVVRGENAFAKLIGVLVVLASRQSLPDASVDDDLACAAAARFEQNRVHGRFRLQSARLRLCSRQGELGHPGWAAEAAGRNNWSRGERRSNQARRVQSAQSQDATRRVTDRLSIQRGSQT